MGQGDLKFMEETTVKNGEVVGFANPSINVTNSIKGSTVKKPEQLEKMETEDKKVVDIGSKMTTDKISIVKKDGTLEAYDVTKVVTAIKNQQTEC